MNSLQSFKCIVCLTGILTLGSAIGAVALAQSAELPQVLEALVGSWRGSGVANSRSGGENEDVSCKARYTDIAEDEAVRVEVTCAALNAKGTLVGFIEYGAGTNQVTGNWYQSWSTSVGEENGPLTGSISNTRVNLNISAAGILRARLTMSLNGANEHKVSLVGIVDGKEEQGMEVVFRR